MIRLTVGDRAILRAAHDAGIGDGFTVPAHVRGEYNGSCSFAVRHDERVPADAAMIAQLIGGMAVEAARRIAQPRRAPRPALMTDRQRDCALCAARGKPDWEISRILGVSHDTVIKLRQQRR